MTIVIETEIKERQSGRTYTIRNVKCLKMYNELPDEYKNSYPQVCYFEQHVPDEVGIQKGIYIKISGEKPDLYVRFNVEYSESYFNEVISLIKSAGNRLHTINKNKRLRNKRHVNVKKVEFRI